MAMGAAPLSSATPSGPLKIWVDVALALDEVVVLVALMRTGLVAPHGWSCAQEAMQLLAWSPHAVWHCRTHSVHTQYDSVSVYSVTLGCLLLPQRQPYVSES